MQTSTTIESFDENQILKSTNPLIFLDNELIFKFNDFFAVEPFHEEGSSTNSVIILVKGNVERLVRLHCRLTPWQVWTAIGKILNDHQCEYSVHVDVVY